MSANPDPQDELQRMLALKRKEAPPARSVSSIARAVREGIHSPAAEEPLPPMARVRELLGSRTVQVLLISVVSIGGLTIGILASRDVTPPRPAPSGGQGDLGHIIGGQPSSPGAIPPQMANPGTAPALPSLEQPAIVSDGVAAGSTLSNRAANAPPSQR